MRGVPPVSLLSAHAACLPLLGHQRKRQTAGGHVESLHSELGDCEREKERGVGGVKENCFVLTEI